MSQDSPGLDGVLLERRTFLKLSVGVLAGLMVGCRPFGSLLDRELGLDDFLQEIQPWADLLTRDPAGDEEAYLKRVAALARRLEGLPPADFHPGKTYSSAFERRRWPVALYQFRIQPGAAIPWHDHRDYAAVMLGLEGEISASSFEVVGKDPFPAKETPFRIRRTRVERITPGSISTLSRRRDNIHDLRAGPAGGRFLDIFTHFERDAASHYLKVQPAGGSPEGTYEARWA